MFKSGKPGKAPPNRMKSWPTLLVANWGTGDSRTSTKPNCINRATVEPATWIAFQRVARDGRRPADVAAELGISVNAVLLAKSRVLRRLRREIHGLAE